MLMRTLRLISAQSSKPDCCFRDSEVGKAGECRSARLSGTANASAKSREPVAGLLRSLRAAEEPHRRVLSADFTRAIGHRPRVKALAHPSLETCPETTSTVGSHTGYIKSIFSPLCIWQLLPPSAVVPRDSFKAGALDGLSGPEPGPRHAPGPTTVPAHHLCRSPGFI